jgi:hypothetical protein
MRSCFTWHEGENAGDPFVKNGTFTAHPRPDGIMFTMRSNMVDKHKKMFNHTQSSFFATHEQIQEMAQLLYLYVQEINKGR